MTEVLFSAPEFNSDEQVPEFRDAPELYISPSEDSQDLPEQRRDELGGVMNDSPTPPEDPDNPGDTTPSELEDNPTKDTEKPKPRIPAHVIEELQKKKEQ